MTDLICSACQSKACAAGDLMCDDARTASFVEVPDPGGMTGAYGADDDLVVRGQPVLVETTLLAHTVVLPDAYARWMTPERGVTFCDMLAEFAGRACYESWDRPNPATARNADYLRHINEVGHFSLYRHASMTVYVTGVSRALTHELVVHKHVAHSQRSQRYVNEEDALTVIPPALRGDVTAEAIVLGAHQQAKVHYAALVARGEAMGLSRKKAREAARAVLPNANETRLVVTGNVQAWRNFILMRLSPHADEEIAEFAQQVRDLLEQVAPNSTQDLPRTVAEREA